MAWCETTILDWAFRPLARWRMTATRNGYWRSTAGRTCRPPSSVKSPRSEFPVPDRSLRCAGIFEGTMTNPELYTGLNEIFRQVLGDDTIALTPSVTAEDVTGWD